MKRAVTLPGMEKRAYGAVIREYRLRAGMEQTALSRALGYSKNTVSNWENGTSRPDLDAVPMLCELLSIPLSVFFGTAPAKRLSPDERELLRSYRGLDEDAREILRENADTLVRREQRRLRERFTRLDYVRFAAAAGVTVPMEEAGTGSVWVRSSALDARADVVFDVNGESMQPKYPDGCRVYARRGVLPARGEDGVFLVNNELFIKRFEADGLHSYDPRFPVMHFSDGDVVRPIARVLGIVNENDRATPEQAWLLKEGK